VIEINPVQALLSVNRDNAKSTAGRAEKPAADFTSANATALHA